MKTELKKVLTIAGSDSSGGAGIQADLKTMIMNGVYGMSAVTALTAQNTTGVRDILAVAPEFLKAELDAVFDDIFPDAVKIGMVASSELIHEIAATLKERKAKNIVVDPVMVSTSGAKLIMDEAKEVLCKELFPLATIITPNIPEAEVLSGLSIKDGSDMQKVAKYISEKYEVAVLLKGGHRINDANDLLYYNGKALWIKGERIANPNTHGTGCTLSSAIASNLAKNYSTEEAVILAKQFISDALSYGLDLGKGSGPMNHGFALTGKYSGQPEAVARRVTAKKRGTKCVIIGGAEIRDYERMKQYIDSDAYIVCCDCGLLHLERLDIKPDLVVGDFDSHDKPDFEVETICLPRQKDDTDTFYAAKEMIKRGYDEFVLIGVIGNRFDHSMGNISILLYLDNCEKKAKIVDDYMEMEIVSNEDATVSDSYSYFSLLNISGTAKGVSIKGAKYPLNNKTIECDYQFAISNEVIPGMEAVISVAEGKLLLTKVFNEEQVKCM